VLWHHDDIYSLVIGSRGLATSSRQRRRTQLGDPKYLDGKQFLFLTLAQTYRHI
jgi:hypothetical protein